ncbi:hypothetical protein K3495_g6094 [Podosphaera aphanis]|nr:hypothetical protein K3495_g6094 [Podosphaera aphanis]
MNSSNTVEPSLISLLNSDETSDVAISSSLDLPTLQDLNILKPSGRFLLPELDARNRLRNAHRAESSHKTLISPTDDDEGPHKGDAVIKCTLGDSSRQSLRKILEDGNKSLITKKRLIPEQNNDDFVQLPQPPKKQKTTIQVVPPIIIGLHEPPPQATLFPPIASSSFHDSHGRNSLNIELLGNKILSKASTEEYDAASIKNPNPVNNNQVLSSKPIATRKKWTEEETNNLLLGVHKHGVGCWTDILNDSNFVFNKRSPADLKDRWRTCCPDELRKKIPTKKRSKNFTGAQVKPRSSLMAENILINDDSISAATDKQELISNQHHKKRAHRKKLEDLAQLGIEGPIRQSSRRERKQFTEEEDLAIEEGYKTYGSAWSRIQKDPRLKLESRRPTDLRDRFRNKFPEKFREDKFSRESKFTLKSKSKGIEKLSLQHDVTGYGTENVSLEALPSAAPQTSFPAFPSRDGLRIQEIISPRSFNPLSNQPPINAVENIPFNHFSSWDHTTSAPFTNNIGEMDKSRLLLDSTWTDLHVPNHRDKNDHPESNHLLPANSDTMHQLPSFFNMLNDPDDLEEPFG